MGESQGLPGLPGRSDVVFCYNGHDVTFDDKRFIDVTQMWRAVGSPKGKEFKNWKRKEGASFVGDLAKSLKVPVGHLYRSVAGRRGGGSWAHWQIALAYAKHLSHEFHRFVNEAFREWAEEKADPDLKAQRAVEGYRRKGWDDQRILVRLEGIVQRNGLTSTLKEHGVHEWGYALCTDAINKEVLGGTAKEIKLARGLNPKARTRDHLNTLELAALRFAETMAQTRVEEDCTHGNGPCCEVCRQAGAATHQAMTSMGLSARAV